MAKIVKKAVPTKTKLLFLCFNSLVHGRWEEPLRVCQLFDGKMNASSYDLI